LGGRGGGGGGKAPVLFGDRAPRARRGLRPARPLAMPPATPTPHHSRAAARCHHEPDQRGRGCPPGECTISYLGYEPVFAGEERRWGDWESDVARATRPTLASRWRRRKRSVPWPAATSDTPSTSTSGSAVAAPSSGRGIPSESSLQSPLSEPGAPSLMFVTVALSSDSFVDTFVPSSSKSAFGVDARFDSSFLSSETYHDKY
jgi:hypothetical protein